MDIIAETEPKGYKSEEARTQRGLGGWTFVIAEAEPKGYKSEEARNT